MLLAPPPPCHKLSHLLGLPPPVERDVLYGRPLSRRLSLSFPDTKPPLFFYYVKTGAVRPTIRGRRQCYAGVFSWFIIFFVLCMIVLKIVILREIEVEIG